MGYRFLKHIPTGQVFMFQSHFAADPAFIEVADAQGTELPPAVVDEEAEVVAGNTVPEPDAKLTKAQQKAKDKADAIAAQEALSADASRGL